VSSPFDLVQESELVGGDPWKVLVACILCNRTSGFRAKGVLALLLRSWPDAIALAKAEPDEVAAMLYPLGLAEVRARRLIAMSAGWEAGVHLASGLGVAALEGVGKYGADAYALFVEERVDVQPTDHDLIRYRDWRTINLERWTKR